MCVAINVLVLRFLLSHINHLISNWVQRNPELWHSIRHKVTAHMKGMIHMMTLENGKQSIVFFLITRQYRPVAWEQGDVDCGTTNPRLTAATGHRWPGDEGSLTVTGYALGLLHGKLVSDRSLRLMSNVFQLWEDEKNNLEVIHLFLPLQLVKTYLLLYSCQDSGKCSIQMVG